MSVLTDQRREDREGEEGRRGTNVKGLRDLVSKRRSDW